MRRTSSARTSPQVAFVDTSVLIRYLVGDSPRHLQPAANIVDKVPQLILTDAVLVECAYVLTSFYKMPRENVVDALVDLISKRNIAVFHIEKTIAIRALLMCRPSKRVSFDDAMLWAVARSAPASQRTIYTFDERFPADDIAVQTDND